MTSKHGPLRVGIGGQVGADLTMMTADARPQTGERPFVMTDLSRLKGLDEVIAFIARQGGLPAAA